jgi:hypothetical protein
MPCPPGGDPPSSGRALSIAFNGQINPVERQFLRKSGAPFHRQQDVLTHEIKKSHGLQLFRGLQTIEINVVEDQPIDRRRIFIGEDKGRTGNQFFTDPQASGQPFNENGLTGSKFATKRNRQTGSLLSTPLLGSLLPSSPPSSG